jgi:hypothetical protein
MRWFLLLPLVLLSCSYFQNDGIEITFDMSKERDQGRFNPEQGDILSIAGSFNEWELQKNILEDPEGDWNYSISITEIPDTLEFKFVVSSSSNLDLPNSGWEIIPNRILAKEILETVRPIFRFNEPWSPIEIKDITFSVSMSNQEILGFFDSSKDEVVVSGSFIGWDSNGIILYDNDKDGVYEQTVPIEINPLQPHNYKFKIQKPSSFNGYIPNDGWEFLDDRVVMSQNSVVQYFNDQKRVARFLVDEQWLQDNTQNGIQRGDMYQIRFLVGGESYLSEPLQKAAGGFYETSQQIPLIVDKVKWTLVENQTRELNDIQETVVTHKGVVITVK